MLDGIFRRAVTLILGNGVSKAALMAFEFTAARALGAEAYGLFSLGLAALFVLSQFCLLGLEFGLVQFLARTQEEGRADRTAGLIYGSLLVTAAAGLVAGLTLFLAADLIAVSVFGKPALAPALRIVGLTVPLESVNQCMAAVFRGLREVRRQLIVSDLARNLMLAALIPFAIWATVPLETLMLVMLIGTLIPCVLGIVRLARVHRFPRLRDGFPLLGTALSFSAPLVAGNIFQKLTGRIQIILAGVFLSSAELGIFALLMRFVAMFTFVQTPVNQSAPVEFARLVHLGRRDELRDLFSRVTLGMMIVSTVVALPIVIDPVRLLDTVGGPAYGPYGGLLLALVIAKALNVGTGPVGHLLINADRRHAVVAIAVGGSVIQAGLLLAFAASWGLAGAVVAEVSASIFLTTARHVISAWLLEIHPFTMRLAGLFAVGVLAALSGAILTRVGPPWVYPIAMVGSIAGYLALGRTFLRRGYPLRDDFDLVRRTLTSRRARREARISTR